MGRVVLGVISPVVVAAATPGMGVVRAGAGVATTLKISKSLSSLLFLPQRLQSQYLYSVISLSIAS